MPENRDYMVRQEELGNIQIAEEVVANLATATAMEVDGVSGLMNTNVSDLLGGKKLSAKGVRVDLEGETLVVNLFLTIRYGCGISDVAGKVQQTVCTTLEGSTGFHVGAVNVHVGGITFN